MAKNIVQKAFFSVFITYFIAYIFYLIWSMFFPPVGPLPNFKLNYIMNQAFINICDNFIALTALGLMLAYSLLYSSFDIQGEDHAAHFYKIVRPVLILVIFLAIIYTILIIWVHPIINKSNQDILFNSQLAKNYLSQAEEEFQKENYGQAMKYLEYTLNIDNNYTRALRVESDLRKKITNLNITLDSNTMRQEGTLDDDTMQTRLENEANQFMILARQSYMDEDYFTAYYNAKRAFELDPSRSDAEILSRDSMNHISDNFYSIADEDQKAIFKAKTEGYRSLFSQDSGDYIKAYYIFKTLEKINPDDPDVEKYLKEVENKINKLTFFLDEVKNIDNYPGYTNILFQNSKDPIEIISIKKMVKATEGIYFKDVEVIRVDANHNIEKHLYAPYGKFIFTQIPDALQTENSHNNKFIALKAIDRENQSISTQPQYFVNKKENTPIAELIQLNPSVDDLPYLQLNPNLALSLSLVELNTARNPIGEFGYPILKLEIEFISRLLKPLIFLIISFFAIGLGWFLRSRYLSKPPLIQLFFIPVFPFVINFIINLINYAYQILISFFIISSGLLPALIAGLAILIVVLFLALVYLASQIIE